MVEALYWLIILKLITDNKTLVKYSSKTTFFSSKSFYENLVAVCKIKETLNRPAYIGMCILDLSKTLMYDFTTIISKTSTMIKGNYHSQTLTVWLMKSKRRMFTKTSAIAHRFDNNEYSEDSKHKKVMENLNTRPEVYQLPNSSYYDQKCTVTLKTMTKAVKLLKVSKRM